MKNNIARGLKPRSPLAVVPHCAAVFGVAFGALSTGALAQTPAQTAQAGTVEEIVVTGTRVLRDGYEAPTPLTVVGIEQIENTVTPNIADFVNTLPQLAGSATPQNQISSVSAGGAGLNTLNLRNLGAVRTLILLDGQRSVGSQATGVVDINDFPQSLISRVDVVTGGASAAYGSDAFSGVVNFILDKNYVGLKGDVSGSVTTYGDDRSWKMSLTAGTAFAGGRGHFLLSAEAFHNDGIFTTQRPWANDGWHIMNNPAYGTNAALGQSTSVPERIVRNHVSQDVITPGGIITAGPLKGIAFGKGGIPYQFQYGSLVADPWMQGGEWQGNDISTLSTLDPRHSHQSLFSRASYDVTDDINVFIQYNWSFSHVDNSQTSPKYNQANLTVKADNAFIPASVQAQMTALKLTNIQMGSMNIQLPPSATDNQRMVNRYVVGGNGKFDAFESTWSWDAYYQYGWSGVSKRFLDRLTKNFGQAWDSVRNAQGIPVCRVNADASTTNDDRNCVPYSLFGSDVNSQASINYIMGTSYNRQYFTQEVMAATVRGEPFSSWAGPVSLAAGIEHRTEGGGGYSDALSTANAYTLGNQLATQGSYNVTEGFVETVIPLAKDAVWAQSFDLNAAIRATSYSTSGYVTTWKVGATWMPIEDIRVRVTRSRDIRAPNRSELFASGIFTTNTLIDPFRNNQGTTYTTNNNGNPNLLPEKGDTTGLGVVLQPQFFPGFSASVDYWNIDISAAIGTLGAQAIVDQCFLGKQQFCAAITRDPVALTISEIKTSPFNFVNQLARGLDFEASYRLALDTVADSWAGNVSFRALATHYLKNYNNNNVATPTDSVGSNSGNGPPNWRWTADLTYALDPIRVGIAARGVSAGVQDTSFIQCTSGCPVSTADHRTIDNNYIAGAIYFDTSFSYKFKHVAEDGLDMEAFLNIKNITNKDPALVATGPGGVTFINPPFNSSLYDSLGRVFRAGVRFKM